MPLAVNARHFHQVVGVPAAAAAAAVAAVALVTGRNAAKFGKQGGLRRGTRGVPHDKLFAEVGKYTPKHTTGAARDERH